MSFVSLFPRYRQFSILILVFGLIVFRVPVLGSSSFNIAISKLASTSHRPSPRSVSPNDPETDNFGSLKKIWPQTCNFRCINDHLTKFDHLSGCSQSDPLKTSRLSEALVRGIYEIAWDICSPKIHQWKVKILWDHPTNKWILLVDLKWSYMSSCHWYFCGGISKMIPIIKATILVYNPSSQIHPTKVFPLLFFSHMTPTPRKNLVAKSQSN